MTVIVSSFCKTDSDLCVGAELRDDGVELLKIVGGRPLPGRILFRHSEQQWLDFLVDIKAGRLSRDALRRAEANSFHCSNGAIITLWSDGNVRVRDCGVDATELEFTSAEWDAFEAGVNNDDFSLLNLFSHGTVVATITPVTASA